MSYNSSENVGWYLGILFILSTILFFMGDEGFSWVLFVWIPLILIFAYDYLKRKYNDALKSVAKKKEKNKPCIHFVEGALYNPHLCPECMEVKSKTEEVLNELKELDLNKKNFQDKCNKLNLETEKKIQDVIHSELDFLRNIDPYLFEVKVGDLFKKLGYKTKVTSKTSDGGKDVIIKKNGETTYVECKRYGENQKVSRPDLQKLCGVMMVDNVKKGIIVTTSNFTKECIEFSKKNKVFDIQLINWEKLISMFQSVSGSDSSSLKYKQYCEHNIEIDNTNRKTQTFSDLKKELSQYKTQCGEIIEFSLKEEVGICSKGHENKNKGKLFYDEALTNTSLHLEFCPICNSHLIEKKQRKTNKKFLGCTSFPKCKYTRSIRR
jgi:restriction endonuclease Mrr